MCNSEYGLQNISQPHGSGSSITDFIKPNDPFSEEVVKEIISLGFSRNDVGLL